MPRALSSALVLATTLSLTFAGCIAPNVDPRMACQDGGWDVRLAVAPQFAVRGEPVDVSLSIRNCGSKTAAYPVPADGCVVTVMVAGSVAGPNGDHTRISLRGNDCDGRSGPEREIKAGATARWSARLAPETLTAGVPDHIPAPFRDGTHWLVLAGPEYERTPPQRGGGFTYEPLTPGAAFFIYTSWNEGSRVPLRVGVGAGPYGPRPGTVVASTPYELETAFGGAWAEPGRVSREPDWAVERAILVAIPAPCRRPLEPTGLTGEAIAVLEGDAMIVRWDPPLDARPGCHRQSLTTVVFAPRDREVKSFDLPEISRTRDYPLRLAPNETFADYHRGSGMENDLWGVDPWRGRSAQNFTIRNPQGRLIASCETEGAPQFGASPEDLDGGCQAGSSNLHGNITRPVYAAALHIHCYGDLPCDLRVTYDG